MFFVVTDGRRLRVIDSSGSIRSIGDTSFDRAPSCDRALFPLAKLQVDDVIKSGRKNRYLSFKF